MVQIAMYNIYIYIYIYIYFKFPFLVISNWLKHIYKYYLLLYTFNKNKRDMSLQKKTKNVFSE